LPRVALAYRGVQNRSEWETEGTGETEETEETGGTEETGEKGESYERVRGER